MFARFCLLFFSSDTAASEIYTLSLHDALPIFAAARKDINVVLQKLQPKDKKKAEGRSEEHTSELQSPCNLVCRLLLEKKKNNQYRTRQLWPRVRSFSHLPE